MAADKNLAKVEQSILEQAAKILFSESRASSEIQLRSFFAATRMKRRKKLKKRLKDFFEKI